MSFFSKFKIGNNTYDVKDALAGKTLSLSGQNLSLLKADGSAASTITLPGGEGVGKAHFEDSTDYPGYRKIVWDDPLNLTSGYYNGKFYMISGDGKRYGDSVYWLWKPACNNLTARIGNAFSGFNVQGLITSFTYLVYVFAQYGTQMEILNPQDVLLSSYGSYMYGSDMEKIALGLLGVPIYTNTSESAFTFKKSDDTTITVDNHTLALYHNGFYAYIGMNLTTAPAKITRSLTSNLTIESVFKLAINDPMYIYMPNSSSSGKKLITLTKTAANNYTLDQTGSTSKNYIIIGRYSFV